MARRLYAEKINIGHLILAGPEAHHGKDVLRLRSNDEVELFDGEGNFAKAIVKKVGRSEIEFDVGEIEQSKPTSPKIILASAMPKYAHQESLVRMCTELGVNVFVPIICEYSSVREKFREEKWHRWSLEACKQSRQNFLPKIMSAMKFDDFLTTITESDYLILGSTAKSQSSEKASFASAGSIIIFVGPEGGFTDQEEQILLDRGATPIKIGRNILRIETAAVALTTLAVQGQLD